MKFHLKVKVTSELFISSKDESDLFMSSKDESIMLFHNDLFISPDGESINSLISELIIFNKVATYAVALICPYYYVT